MITTHITLIWDKTKEDETLHHWLIGNILKGKNKTYIQA